MWAVAVRCQRQLLRAGRPVCSLTAVHCTRTTTGVPYSLPPGKVGAMAKSYDPLVVELGWYQWWEENGLFKPRGTGTPFSMVLPPPNVTGVLHVGHALTVAIQDAIVRRRRMLGDDVVWVPGLDHAGIATQSVVERQLFAKEGQTRHELGREAFVEKVWEWKDVHGGVINDQLRRVGASLDWSREVFTMDAPRSAAVTHAFVQLHDMGLLDRRNRLVNWCPFLHTAISDIEVDTVQLDGPTTLTLPSKRGPVRCEFGVIDTFTYPCEGGVGGIRVSTTRLETMVGDVAVAVHPEDQRYCHLIGTHVVHPISGHRLPVVGDAVLVDPALGTGAVKVTPAHDANDFECGLRHSLPQINVLTDDGCLNERGGAFSGMGRFEARVALRAHLQSLGLYEGTAPNPMTLAVCSRTGDVLEPMLKPQWYVKCVGALSDAAVDVVTQGKMVLRPSNQEGLWQQWLGKSQDWCISRQLWWGHRVPAFSVPVSAFEPAFTSFDHEELGFEISKALESAAVGCPVTLHEGRLWVVAKEIDTARARLQQTMRSLMPELDTGLAALRLEQDPDVLDTWFSSGLFPLTVFGWPNTSAPDLLKYYPLDILETGQDILFFWVARMAMLCNTLSGTPPFKEVWLHPVVRDAAGRKMSKSTGNVIDPMHVIMGTALVSTPCGADALRMTLASYAQCTPGLQIHLDAARAEHYRQFGNKLWNAAKFVIAHCSALPSAPVPPPPSSSASPPPQCAARAFEGLGPTSLLTAPAIVASGRASVADLWMLSRLAACAAACDAAMCSFDLAAAVAAVYKLTVVEFCETYVEWCKWDLGEEATDERRDVCRAVLRVVFDGILRLLHPFMPFVTEELWQRLSNPSAFDHHENLIVGHDDWNQAPASPSPVVSIMTSTVPDSLWWADLKNEQAERLMTDAVAVTATARAVVKTALDLLPDVKRKSVTVQLQFTCPVAADTHRDLLANYTQVLRAGDVVVTAPPGHYSDQTRPHTGSQARTVSKVATGTCTVVAVLPSDDVSEEKLAAAYARVRDKLGKQQRVLLQMQVVSDTQAGSDKVPAQAKLKHQERLELQLLEVKQLEEVLAHIRSWTGEK